MGPIVKAVVSGAGGAILGDMIEPYLVQWFKPETDFAKKAAKAGAIGIGSGAIYWGLSAFTKGA